MKILIVSDTHRKTEYLESYGLQILRIPNSEINSNFYGVCEYIDKVVRQVSLR